MLKQAAYFSGFVILALAIFVAGERFLSPSFQRCIQGYEYSSGNTAAENDPSAFGVYVRCSGRFADEHGSGITALATIIIAGFTGTLWIATSRQAKLTKIAADAALKSAKVSESALVELERPFIFWFGIKHDVDIYLAPRTGWDPETSGPHFNLVLVNHGRTPANIDSAMAVFEVRADEPVNFEQQREAPAGVNPESAEIIIGPNSKFTFPEMRCRHNFLHDHAARIRQGTAHLYCYGWLSYLDIFGNRHPTVFCRRYVPRLDEWEPVGGKAKNYAK